jgi:replicative DNA helicase
VRREERRVNRRAIGVRAERELVRTLLHHRRYVEAAAERIGGETFADPAYRAIFQQLATHDAETPLDAVAAPLDDDATAVLQELIEERGGLDRVDETIDASINALLSRGIADRLTEIDRLLPLAESDEKDQLIQEKRRLAAELQALGRPRWKHFNSTRL